MGDEELRVALRPDAVMRTIEAAMNRPAQRVLGMKVANQYVGVIDGRRFEVWERRGHAVHLLGVVSAEGGGSRVVLRTGMTLRSRILIGLFFVLFAVVAFGLGTLPVERQMPEATPFLAVAGAAAAAALFVYSARTQAAELRRFVAKALAASPPG